MSNRTPNLLVADILDSTHKILDYTKDLSFDDFIKERVDAVIRNFEIIGEAANRLPEEFKDKYPSIDWHRIRGFRNRIVDDYFGIDYAIVWQIRDSFLANMISDLQKIP